MDTLKQIGELLLSSIPTIILLLIVWIAYRNIVQRKLERVLGERHARTEGAIQEAQSEITKAETRTAEYEQRMREARAHVFQTQEARRRHIMEERGAALAEARRQADERVKHATADLRKDIEEAKAGLAHQAEALAQEIIHSILKPLVATEGR